MRPIENLRALHLEELILQGSYVGFPKYNETRHGHPHVPFVDCLPSSIQVLGICQLSTDDEDEIQTLSERAVDRLPNLERIIFIGSDEEQKTRLAAICRGLNTIFVDDLASVHFQYTTVDKIEILQQDGDYLIEELVKGHYTVHINWDSPSWEQEEEDDTWQGPWRTWAEDSILYEDLYRRYHPGS